MNIEGLRCDALTRSDVDALPLAYAGVAGHARDVGFNGVEIHAGHGFSSGQFLSRLFNRRSDRDGGSIEAGCQLLLAIVRQVRAEVGSRFATAVKINSSDQLEGGLSEDDAVVTISLPGDERVHLFDISGGTYFPGAPFPGAPASACARRRDR